MGFLKGVTPHFQVNNANPRFFFSPKIADQFFSYVRRRSQLHCPICKSELAHFEICSTVRDSHALSRLSTAALCFKDSLNSRHSMNVRRKTNTCRCSRDDNVNFACLCVSYAMLCLLTLMSPCKWKISRESLRVVVMVIFLK